MDNDTKDRFLTLAHELGTPSDVRWEPNAYDKYEQEAADYIRQASKVRILSLVEALEELISAGETHPGYALFPILVAFLERYGVRTDIALEAYYCATGAGGRLLEEAPRFLLLAYESDPGNPHVLWELWKSYSAPYFPQNLRFSLDPTEHEMMCLRSILSANPNDTLARKVLDWIEERRARYRGSRNVPKPIHEIDLATRPTSNRSYREMLERSDP